MILCRELAGEIDNDRLVLAGWESDVRARRRPLAGGVTYFERRQHCLDFRLLRERDVDARIGGIDPAAQEERRTRTSRVITEIEDQIVRLYEALIREWREIRDVNLIKFPQRGEHVVTLLVRRRERRMGAHDVEEVQLQWPGRHEALVHEDVHGIRVIHGEQLDLIR